MCGIVGVVSDRKLNDKCAEELAINNLKNLEYRGYDSFGFISNSRDSAIKALGAVTQSNFEFDKSSKIAIAHTRWATHGRVTIENAHPHVSMNGKFAIVHNGVISNYKKIKSFLTGVGYEFQSETDSEVIANLLEYIGEDSNSKTVFECIEAAKSYLEGEYALCIMHWGGLANTLYAVSNQSPLLVGICRERQYAVIASDTDAFDSHVEKYTRLREGEIVSVQANGFSIKSSIYRDDYSSHFKTFTYQDVSSSLDRYPDFMSKEMAQIPRCIEQAARTPVCSASDFIQDSDVIITGCGSAFYAAQIGSFMRDRSFTTLALPADEMESLYRLRDSDKLICISQSGETYDTIMPAKAFGNVVSITNSQDSTLTKHSSHHIFQAIGKEACVLSTKSIVSQCALLYKVFEEYRGVLTESGLETLAAKWELAFKEGAGVRKKLEALAERCVQIDHYFHIGRGVHNPIAYENALKLKEVTYVHAEGMGAGFFKHGTLSLIDDRFLTFVHLPDESVDPKSFELTQANAQEIEARSGWVIRVGHDASTCDIVLPQVTDMLSPLLHLGVGQYFAYYLAKKLDRNVDRPRSLAKSVTVR